MAEANTAQIQAFANERMRPWCEKIREAYLQAKDHRASIDDVYEALTGSHSGWTDSRTDGPPHLLAANDQLAWNTFMADFVTFIEGGGQVQPNAQWPVILKACVRSVQG